MEKKTWGMILMLPARLILILMAVGAIYAKVSGAYPMQWATPITIALISVIYFVGLYLSKQNSTSDFSSSSKSESSSTLSLGPSKEVSMPKLSSASSFSDSGIKPRVVRLG
jgi:hypothetical protein